MRTDTPRLQLTISFTLFSLAILFLFFTALNGYLLNLVNGYRANVWMVTAGVLVEFAALYVSMRHRIVVESNVLELAGFLITVIGVWTYFIAASLPTLLPPTQSEDAVRVYLQVLFTFPEGKLVSWYPAGGTFLVATISHWLGWHPLRVLHPTAAAFIALSAGAVYGMTCAILRPPLTGSVAKHNIRVNDPDSNLAKRDAPADRGRGLAGESAPILALVAPALLFVPWSYFAGIIDWEQYFFAQALAQLFILAALWYTMGYANQPSSIFWVLIGMALLGTVIAYPIFVSLPFGLFSMVVSARLLSGARRRTLVPLGIFLALLFLAAITLDRAGILELGTAQISALQDVGVGGVATPSFETFGGIFFILLALVGIPITWRANTNGKTLIALLLVWAMQYVALVGLQPILKISGYRVDKTVYFLVFPLAMLGTLAIGRVLGRLRPLRRATALSWVAVVIALSVAIAIFRPPAYFSPFSESELQAAQWAKKNLDTYQISYLDPETIRAYWLAFGLWGETLPNEWYQWIPAGVKLGPRSFEEWLADPSWPSYIFVPNVNVLGSAPVQVVFQHGPVVIAQKNSGGIKPPAPTRLARWHYGTSVNLVGYDLPREKFTPGETLTVTTYTEAIYPPSASVRWRVSLVDRNQVVVSQMERDPFENKYPVQRWSPGKSAIDDWSLPIQGNASPGAYELRLGLFFRESGKWQSVWPIQSDGLGKPLNAVPLATIKIPVGAPSAAELRGAQSIDTRLGENISLRAYRLNVDRTARRIQLTLYWESLARTSNDYTVFVHLLDANGQVIAQNDREPLDGKYPTRIWDAQEVIKDEYDLTIPADASMPLKIELGMYSQPSLKRLAIGDSDRIVLDIP